MRVKITFSTILMFAILGSLLLPSKALADWAYSFVVYDGNVYVISDEYVTEIDKEIGKVTKYSDVEGTYSGNFSNTYKKGTKYYSIQGVNADTAIAVEVNNDTYIKATYNGEYAGKKYDPTIFMGGVILIVIIASSIFIVRKLVTRNKTY